MKKGKIKKWMILLTILTILIVPINKAKAFAYTPGGTYYRITGTNNWRGTNKHDYNADPYFFWAITPEAYSVSIMYEYGLPVGEGTLQLAVVVDGNITYVPQVKISAEGEQILCMNSLMQAYGTTKVFNYFCPGYKFTSGYNSIGVNYEYDPNSPNIRHIGISKDMHIAGISDTGTQQAINNQTTTITNNQNAIWQQEAQHWDEMENADISNNAKQQPSQQNYDSVHTFEEGIFNDLEDPNILALIDLGIDTETNNWIWNTMTGIFNANVRVMSMVISVLTLGLAKFLMGR